MSIVTIGGGIVILLALLNEPKGTVKLLVAVITMRGITWLAQKITAALNRDSSEIINFAGWSLAAVPAIGLIKNALSGVNEFAADMQKVGEFFNSIGAWIDKITFWN